MKLEQVLLQGIRADQPAFSDVGAGTLYCVTDEGFIIEQSDGAAWSPYSPAVVSPGITQLTGDVTAGPGSGSVAATIANDAVTDAKLRDSGALSVIGRSVNSSGNPADIAATPASGAVLRESGSVLGFGTIVAAGIASDAVITAKILNSNVTLAKIVDVSAASRLIGRGSAGGAGVQEEITLSTGLSMSGTALSATGAGSTTLNEVVGQLDINNTGSETALWTKSITGGLIAATGFLRLEIRGDYLNNSGSSKTLQVKIKYGGTTLWDSTTGNIAAGATRRGFWIDVVLGNLGATNSQFGQINFELGDLTAVASGNGSLNATPIVATRTGIGTSAEDSTSTLTFQVTVTLSGTPTVNHGIRRQFASLELLNA